MKSTKHVRTRSKKEQEGEEARNKKKQEEDEEEEETSKHASRKELQFRFEAIGSFRVPFTRLVNRSITKNL